MPDPAVPASADPSMPAHGGELSVDEARARILAALQPVQPVTRAEQVPLAQALGRVLAAPLVSPLDVPAHDNAAMDGYAFRGADLRPGRPTRLALVGETVLAGHPCVTPPQPGECVRIMTGAMMPVGLDTVVPQELCSVSVVEGQRWVSWPADAVRPQDHRRRRGEDLAVGEQALPAGRCLRPADLGLAASLGVADLSVKPRLRVALFSSGDELRAPGQPLAPGALYDSNRYSLLGALQRLGAEVLDLGTVPDDPAALEAVLDEALAWRANAVVTSGGVSVGDADHTRTLLARRGRLGFWQVAMRPGRPFAFGQLNGDGGEGTVGPWLFALPGNPVAAIVSFYVLVREALGRLAGADTPPLPRLRVRAAEPMRKRPGRSEYQRGIVSQAPEGHWQVVLTGAQGAGQLHSMTRANALVLLGAAQGPVAVGDEVEVWLFDGLT